MLMDLDLILQITELIALILFVIFGIIGLVSIGKIRSFLNETESKINKAEIEFNIIAEKAKTSIEDAKSIKPMIENALIKVDRIQDEAIKRLEEFEDTNKNLNELLISGKNTSETFNKTGEELNQKIDEIDQTITPIKNLVDEAYHQVYKPVKTVTKFARAVNKGLNVFKGKMSAGK